VYAGNSAFFVPVVSPVLKGVPVVHLSEKYLKSSLSSFDASASSQLAADAAAANGR